MSYLSSIILAAFSQIALTRNFFHALLERSAFTVIPELSENSESMNAATASLWPSRSSTLRIALAIFLKVFISAMVYDLWREVRGNVCEHHGGLLQAFMRLIEIGANVRWARCKSSMRGRRGLSFIR